jgi:uncharacterized membrane protein YedE/YeeE
MDWNAFTPGPAFSGGLLIGLAAAILVLGCGRIAGISGIVGGLLGSRHGPAGWRIAFVAGLVLAPLTWSAVATLPATRIDADLPTLVVAGLLVGLGTRYGAGCTSGHGVCGLSRGSIRSVVATGCFMAAGFATVFVVRHLLAG